MPVILLGLLIGAAAAGGTVWYLSPSSGMTCTALAEKIGREEEASGHIPLESRTFPIPGLEDSVELVVLGNPSDKTATVHMLVPSEIGSAVVTLEGHGFTVVQECVGDTGKDITYLRKEVKTNQPPPRGA